GDYPASAVDCWLESGPTDRVVPTGRRRAAMKASVGDRIVIASNRLDHPLRDGKIVECPHDDGSPPYVVEWSDTGQTGLFFPGPDAHVEHHGDEDAAVQQA